MPTTDEQTCPSRKSPLKPGARFCSECGKAVETESPSFAVPVAQKGGEEWREELRPDADFEDELHEAQYETAHQRSWSQKAFIVALVVLPSFLAGVSSLTAWPAFGLDSHTAVIVAVATSLGGIVAIFLGALVAWLSSKREEDDWYDALFESVWDIAGANFVSILIGILVGALSLAVWPAFGLGAHAALRIAASVFLGGFAIFLVAFVSWIFKKNGEKGWGDVVGNVAGIGFIVIIDSILAGLLSLAAWPLFGLEAHAAFRIAARALLGGATATFLVAFVSWVFNKNGEKNWYDVLCDVVGNIIGAIFTAIGIGILAGLLSLAAWPLFGLVASSALEIARTAFLGGFAISLVVASVVWLCMWNSEKKWYNVLWGVVGNIIGAIFAAIGIGILIGALSLVAWPLFALDTRSALEIARVAFLGGFAISLVVALLVWLFSKNGVTDLGDIIGNVFGVGFMAAIVGLLVGALSLVTWPIFGLNVRAALQIAALVFLGGFGLFIGMSYAVWLYKKRRNGLHKGFAAWMLE